MKTRPWIALSLSLACASSPKQDTDASTGGAGSEGGDATTGADASSSGTTLAPDLASLDDTPVGIGIARVEISQGTSTVLFAGGAAIAPEDRGAALVAGRPAMVRVELELADDFAPRPIRATLEIETELGVTTVHDEPMLDATTPAFMLSVPLEALRPEATWSLALTEVAPRVESDTAVASPTRIADDEPLPLGVAAGPHTLELVLVPFDYDDGAGCVTSPQLDDATLQLFEDALYQQLPIDRVVTTVHPRETWTEPFEDLLAVNERLIDLRMAESALPQVVYYGVIDACQPQTGTIGMAYGMLLPTSMEMSFTRCAAGKWWDFDLEEVANTMVHEVGHTLGRLHVVCSGGEGFPTDGSYPNDDGALDVWGHGVLDGIVRPAEGTADFMSYCEPSWISRYGWNELQPVVQTISGWPTTPGRAPVGRMLVGVVGPEGASRWRVVPGTAPLPTGGDAPRVKLRVDGVAQTIVGTATPLPDDPTLAMVIAPLPERGAIEVLAW